MHPAELSVYNVQKGCAKLLLHMKSFVIHYPLCVHCTLHPLLRRSALINDNIKSPAGAEQAAWWMNKPGCSQFMQLQYDAGQGEGEVATLHCYLVKLTTCMITCQLTPTIGNKTQNHYWVSRESKQSSGVCQEQEPSQGFCLGIVYCRRTLWTRCNRQGSATSAFKTAQSRHWHALAAAFICSEHKLMTSWSLLQRKEPEIVSLMRMNPLDLHMLLEALKG